MRGAAVVATLAQAGRASRRQGGPAARDVPSQGSQEMTDRRTDPLLQDLDRRLVIGAGVMLAVASLAGLAGSVMCGIALIDASRRWYRRVDLAPHELANLKLRQAKAAMGAGAGAWSDAERSVYSPRSGRRR
jgi:hypothetical protein